MMMMVWKFFSIGAIMMMSLLGAQAFAAGGGGDYTPTAAKPAAYNKALALIKDKNYEKAIVILNKLKLRPKKTLISKIYWGLSIASRASWTRPRNIINLPWRSTQSIRAPWNIKGNCF